MALELFAVVPVSDYEQALPWYERLLGASPSFLPHDTEAVWELAEHRYLVIDQRTELAGGGIPTIFVDDLDARVAQAAARGIDPSETETYDNGVRKVIYRDADGNEIGFGGGPESDG
jgi:hypothetical protein